MAQKKNVPESYWKKMRSKYIKDKLSLRRLAAESLSKKYGVSYTMIQKRSQKENWIEMRNQNDIKVAKKAADILAEQEQREIALFAQIKSKFLKRVSEEIDLGIATKDMVSSIRLAKELVGVKDPDEVAYNKARIEELKTRAAKNKIYDSDDEDTVNIAFIPEIIDIGDLNE